MPIAPESRREISSCDSTNDSATTCGVSAQAVLSSFDDRVELADSGPLLQILQSLQRGGPISPVSLILLRVR